jgi:hypothetical protein
MFKNILIQIKNGKFLPLTAKINSDWAGGLDSKKNFDRNLIIKGKNWEYFNKKVKYTQNKNGYRTYNFDTIDWKNSVILFGCSNVFGVGLDDSDTISSRLSKIINRPVINMGGPGTSITFSFHNNLILKNHYPTPIAVVNLWTSYDRCIYYKKFNVLELGSWSLNDPYYRMWSLSESNPIIQGYFCLMAARHSWSHIKYYEASMFKETAKKFDIDYIDRLDDARDLMHPGSQTSLFTAEKIAKNLNV